MIGAYDVSSSKWLWQEIPMSRGEGMLEHIALDTNDLDDDTDVTEYSQYAVHEDRQSTVWTLSDTVGAIVEQYVQDDPFGKTHTLNSSGTDIGDFASKAYHVKRMHGGVTEEVTGLYDFRNRWLASESGSWLSRDPLGANNLYDGFTGNPLSKVDFFGLQAQDPSGKVEKLLDQAISSLNKLPAKLGSRINSLLQAQSSLAGGIGEIYGMMKGLNMCFRDCCPDVSVCDKLDDGGHVMPRLPVPKGPLDVFGRKVAVKGSAGYKKMNAAWGQSYLWAGTTPVGGYSAPIMWDAARSACREVVEGCREFRACKKGVVIMYGDPGCPRTPTRLNYGRTTCVGFPPPPPPGDDDGPRTAPNSPATGQYD